MKNTFLILAISTFTLFSCSPVYFVNDGNTIPKGKAEANTITGKGRSLYLFSLIPVSKNGAKFKAGETYTSQLHAWDIAFGLIPYNPLSTHTVIKN